MPDAPERQQLMRLAIDKGIEPSAAGISRAAGLPERTVRAWLGGRAPSARTQAALWQAFGTTDLGGGRGQRDTGNGDGRAGLHRGDGRAAPAGAGAAGGGDDDGGRRRAAVMAAHSEAWHARRRSGIGSSDIAGILGVSPWASPYSVWQEKLSGGGPGTGSERMRWGNLLENVVMDEAARRLGVTVTGRQVQARHPDRPWAIATLDGTYDDAAGAGPPGVLEVKTTSDRKWARVPVYYEAQVQWQLEVAQLEVAWVACLHAGQKLSLHRIGRDRDAGAALVRIGGRFWDRHVTPGMPPPIDASEATAGAVARRYEHSEPLLVADLTGQSAAIGRLREIHAEQDRLAAERRRIESGIKAALGAAEAGQVAGDVAVTWKPQVSRRIDSERLREEQPAVAEQYTVETPSRRLLLRGAREEETA